jgi:hypothetical protein
VKDLKEKVRELKAILQRRNFPALGLRLVHSWMAVAGGGSISNSKHTQTMKTAVKILTLALAICAGATLLAQDAPQAPEGAPPGGPGGRGPGHRPPPPIIGVIDANHDGIIDADEIANAAAALAKLDKNGDGKLTPDEFMGPRPGPGGPGGHPPGPPPGGPQGEAPQGGFSAPGNQ